MRNRIEELGGGLAFVGALIVYFLVKTVLGAIFTYPGLFADGTWAALTTPGSEDYHHLWAPLLIGEMAVDAVLVLAWTFTGFLFLSRKKIFSKWFIGLLLFMPLYILVDTYLVAMVLPDEPMFDRATTRQLARAAIAALIAVPYVLVSKRVKAAFVNH